MFCPFDIRPFNETKLTKECQLSGMIWWNIEEIELVFAQISEISDIPSFVFSFDRSQTPSPFLSPITEPFNIAVYTPIIPHIQDF